MGNTNSGSKKTATKPRPPLSHEAREVQLIAMAEAEAEYQLKNHKASSQVITHFLKLGCEKTRLEQEKLRHETELLKAKTEMTKAAKASEELYSKALAAMRDYSGRGDSSDD